MTMTADSNRAPPRERLFHRIPVIGWMAKGISRGITMVFCALLIAAAALVFAVNAWGPVALTMAALCLVPLMFAFFVAISWPGRAAK